jgi:hypothetical protein
MPYRVQRPYIIVNDQRFVGRAAVPQRLPFCDRTSELASTSAGLYNEIAIDRWWKWFLYPRFSCQPEARMGCENHPVQPEIRFLDGRVLIQITHKRSMLGKAFLETLKGDPTLMHEARRQIGREVADNDQLRILEFKPTYQWTIDRAR